MALSEFLADLLVRLCIALLFVAVNAVILHYIAERMKFKDESFDNPTSIAILVSALLVIDSYVPKYKLPFFLITNTLIPLVFMKEFYSIGWKDAIKMWGIWAGTMVVIAAIVALILALTL